MTEFTEVFSHLCHLTAITVDRKTPQAIQDAVLTILVLHPETSPNHTGAILEALDGYFGVRVSAQSIEEAVAQLTASKSLLQTGPDNSHVSSESSRRVQDRIEYNSNLESQVRNQWLVDVRADNPNEDISLRVEDILWLSLKEYLATVFRMHGSQTIDLIRTEESGDQIRPSSLTSILETLASTKLASIDPKLTIQSIKLFLNHLNDIRLKYLLGLLDGTWTFFAISAEEYAGNYLRLRKLPELKVFVDTNFIFSVLDMHEDANPLADASRALLNAIKNSDLPITIHYHRATLSEFQGAVDSQSASIRGKLWPSSISKALVGSCKLHGLPLAFHQLNAKTFTQPEIFLKKYEYVQRILDDHGFIIYNPTRDPYSEEERWELVARYLEFLGRRVEEWRYTRYDHDMTILLAARYQRRGGMSMLDRGSVLLTCDFKLYSFDQKCHSSSNSPRIVTLPTHLLQVIRPYVTESVDFDKRFIEAIALPEFRSTSVDYSSTVQKAGAYMGSLRGLSEEVAIDIISNELLLERLKSVEDDDKQFVELVDSALAETADRLNEALKATAAELRDTQSRLNALDAERSGLQTNLKQSDETVASLIAVQEDSDRRLREFTASHDQLIGEVNSIKAEQAADRLALHEAKKKHHALIQRLLWVVPLMVLALVGALWYILKLGQSPVWGRRTYIVVCAVLFVSSLAFPLRSNRGKRASWIVGSIAFVSALVTIYAWIESGVAVP